MQPMREGQGARKTRGYPRVMVERDVLGRTREGMTRRTGGGTDSVKEEGASLSKKPNP